MSESKRFLIYARVSTARQGESFLGLQGQLDGCAAYAASVGGSVIGTYVDIASGKGADALKRRPKLAECLKRAKKEHATVLIWKLDRLSRSLTLISILMDKKTDFVIASSPSITSALIQVMAIFAQLEREQISERTKLALQKAKEAGKVLGRQGVILARHNKDAADAKALELLPIIQPMIEAGISSCKIAKELNRRKVRSPKGAKWFASGVINYRKRIERITA